jgi:hypothetical protein
MKREVLTATNVGTAAACAIAVGLTIASAHADTAAQQKAWAEYVAQHPLSAREAYCVKHPMTVSAAEADRSELAVQAVIKQSARDPGSVRFDPYQFTGLDHGNCGEIEYVCGKVNGKNGFGGYTGSQRYVFVTSGPRKGELKVGASLADEKKACGAQVEFAD